MTELEQYIAKCEANAIPDSEIDTSEIPELTEKDFERGHFTNFKPMKKSVTFRIDLDNLAWLQSAGVKDYQKRMNAVIRWARENNCPITAV